jgi:hypothetical protein
MPMRSIVFILTALVGTAWSQSSPVSALEMKPGDHLLIRYQSQGCFHQTKHDLVITRTQGDAELTGIDHSPHYDAKTKSVVKDPKTPLLKAELTEAELAKLDKSFEFLRQNPQGGCTTVNDIVAVVQRGDKAVAREKFTDATCRLDDDPQRMGFWQLVEKIIPQSKASKS